MEPQETIYCYDNREKKCDKRKNCLGIVAIILLAVLGAAVSGAILGALAAIIVLAVVLGLLLILTIILMLCNTKKENEHKCKCC